MRPMCERHRDICNKWPNYRYWIWGCGAIGASVATTLARQGAERFILIDYDTLDEVNIGTSPYLKTQIGQAKVLALRDLLSAIIIPDDESENLDPTDKIHFFEHKIISQDSVAAMIGRFSNDVVLGNIHIIGFDNMEVRMKVAQVLAQVNYITAVIDARMGAEQMQIYSWHTACNKFSITDYKRVWYSDKDGSSDPCTMKSTFYCVNTLAGFVGSILRKMMTSQPYEKLIHFDFSDMGMETQVINPLVKQTLEERAMPVLSVPTSAQ